MTSITTPAAAAPFARVGLALPKDRLMRAGLGLAIAGILAADVSALMHHDASRAAAPTRPAPIAATMADAPALAEPDASPFMQSLADQLAAANAASVAASTPVAAAAAAPALVAGPSMAPPAPARPSIKPTTGAATKPAGPLPVETLERVPEVVATVPKVVATVPVVGPVVAPVLETVLAPVAPVVDTLPAVPVPAVLAPVIADVPAAVLPSL